MMSSNDEESNIECMPFCEECLSGICVSPSQCLCSPGYHGDNCESGEFRFVRIFTARISIFVYFLYKDSIHKFYLFYYCL